MSNSSTVTTARDGIVVSPSGWDWAIESDDPPAPPTPPWKHPGWLALGVAGVIVGIAIGLLLTCR